MTPPTGDAAVTVVADGPGPQHRTVEAAPARSDRLGDVVRLLTGHLWPATDGRRDG